MNLTEFDYELPVELVAQYPIKERENARLMVLSRKEGTVDHKVFSDIKEYFKKGDTLVLNDTKVIQARLFGKRKTGGKVEIFLLEKKNPVCEVLLRPSLRVKDGESLTLESGDELEVLERGPIGRFVKFANPVDEVLSRCGHTPLPPYIKRPDEDRDKVDYQTVYAKNAGATASPTAGLHFTSDLLKAIEEKGVRVCYVTLHTSYGTFAPVKHEKIEDHRMHAEYFNMPDESAKVISDTKKDRGKIFAVGTTATRVLEHYFNKKEKAGYTDLFIYPSYKFKVVDCLVTNFHLPKSTLLMLVSAFSKREFILKAYKEAIDKGYRFFSYGDAMLII